MPSFIRLFLLSGLLILTLPGLTRADDNFTINPRISTSAVYNDNVQETRKGRGDYSVSVKPGVTAHYDHSRVLFDLSYDTEYVNYLNNVRKDEWNNYLTSRLNVEALQDLFYLDVSDNYSRVYNNYTRGDMSEGDTTNDTTDLNTFVLNPYFSFNPQPRTNLAIGAKYSNLWYSDESSIDKTIYDYYVEVKHELTPAWSLYGGPGFHQQRPIGRPGGQDRYDVEVGTVYDYAENCRIDLSLTPTHTKYVEGETQDKDTFPYQVTLTHALSRALALTVITSRTYTEDAASADSKLSERNSAGLAWDYGRGVVNASVAYFQYDNDNSETQTIYWQPQVSGSHQLSERLKVRYNLQVSLYNSESTRRSFGTLALDYELSNNFTTSLTYRLKNVEESGLSNDYTSNSIGLNFEWKLY